MNVKIEETSNDIKYIVKDGKVVCYLYGYPENNKIGFNCGKYEGNYIKLTDEQKLSFRITITKNGIRNLHYIK
jgi:chromosome condensin MukBEF MukE localization factor